MFTNIPSSLLAAQIMTFSKGQENQARFSDEEQELKRALIQEDAGMDTFKKSEEQTAGAQGGTLA